MLEIELSFNFKDFLGGEGEGIFNVLKLCSVIKFFPASSHLLCFQATVWPAVVLCRDLAKIRGGGGLTLLKSILKRGKGTRKKKSRDIKTRTSCKLLKTSNNIMYNTLILNNMM